ncbi:hypothetical protein LCGC14_1564370 [marine sediment metagenome]|uniref:Uncharacterized protein n=1 Tax=marine sediment metagenome TaxID=412755 RepID=A0A0F9J7N9_9ZZZZ
MTDLEKLLEAAAKHELKCPKCGGSTEERPDSYHWRGQYFPGCYCKQCNSLWSQGPGYEQFMEAVKASH